MSIFRIAWRSICQRGIASFLTTFSMSLGVMLVVIVLTLHGLIAESFNRNSTVGYNIVVGARGGSMQLALNSVYYLSRPLETIPYEYYLAFRSREDRAAEIEDSIINRSRESSWNAIEMQTMATPMPGLSAPALFAGVTSQRTMQVAEDESTGRFVPGIFASYAEIAVPICLGDYFGEYRVVATTPEFVDKIELNVQTGAMIEMDEGRNFETFNEEHGYFECIVGSVVAKRMDVEVGDKINPTHGAPDGKKHESGFTVVGIMKETRTPSDRAVYINIEGFYLMDDHAKPINEESQTSSSQDSDPAGDPLIDDWGDEDWGDEDWGDGTSGDETSDGETSDGDGTDDGMTGDAESSDDAESADSADSSDDESNEEESEEEKIVYSDIIYQERLPLEQREITAVLVRTAGVSQEVLDAADEDDRAFLELTTVHSAMQLATDINEGELEKTLNWTPFRPERAQKSAQSITPVAEIRMLLDVFVAPIQLILLLLTVMICIVAGMGILVSIYNSMNERKSEIAVMRALGARRGTVMSIILLETLMLSVAGGVVGWTTAHGLNIAISPYVEYHTGVSVGFFDFAPPVRILSIFGNDSFKIWPELALIPGLVVLSTIVGLYPAFAAYRTDVAKALTA